MKVFLSLAFLAAVAFAEPPQYRQQQQQQQQRYYFAKQEEAPSGPYSPRGWKPDGPAFNLPERQQQQPKQQYGPPAQPQQQYGPPAQPQQQYGPPPQPQQQYGPPAQPQQQYGPPAQPQQQYGPPAQPQQQYGAPAKQQYAPVSQPQVSIFKPQFGRQQAAQPQQPQFRPSFNVAPQQPQQYGPPAAPQQYAPPRTQYGTPDFDEATTPISPAEFEESTSVIGLPESEPESTSSANELDDDADIDGPQPETREKQEPQQQQRGEYYVALPDGRLQRVRYVSKQDVEAMRYFAKIRAENVEPLRGPIYAYAPLQKLEVTPGALQVAVGPVSAVAEQPTNGLTITAAEKKPERFTAASAPVDVQPLAQLQIQHDSPQTVLPLTSSYATFTADYRVPIADTIPANERFILALP